MHPRSITVTFALLSVLSLIALYAPAARAGETEAAEHFKAGAAAYARGDYRGAATSFERAYRESPRGATIYNAGLAWESGGEGARAADAYATAIAGDLGPPQLGDARARLAALEKSVGRIEVRAPAGTRVSVAHAEGVAAPATVHVAPGAHEVTARFTDGTIARRAVTAPAGAATQAVFEAPKPALAALPSRPPAARPAGKDTPPAPSGARKTAGFIALGGAVVASGAGVLLGVSALSARDDFNASGHHDQSAHDRADSLRTMTNVAWIAAGVLAASGAVLVLTAPSAPSTATASVGPRGAFVTVRF